MAAYLTIDIGNTSVKAALWLDGERADIPASGPLTPETTGELLRMCPPLSAIAVSNVSEPVDEAMLALREAAPLVINLSAATPLPIALDGYAHASTLGPDRIAALCGAQALMPGRELLVVDCGTAVTYDRLSASGAFLGGNIAPGATLRLRSLHEHTARLPMPQLDEEPCPLFGSSTAQAMLAGALRGIAAEIEYYLDACPGCHAVVTGGESRLIAPLLGERATLVPGLVMAGLKCIIDYNENIC